jgi:hypothetical protein
MWSKHRISRLLGIAGLLIALGLSHVSHTGYAQATPPADPRGPDSPKPIMKTPLPVTRTSRSTKSVDLSDLTVNSTAPNPALAQPQVGFVGGGLP